MRFLFFLLFSINAQAITLDYYLDGDPVTPIVDTGTPGNTLAYPVGYFNTSGVQTDLGTEATLLLIEGKDFATETTLAALDAKVVTVDTDDVTITSSVLPTGAATEAKQDAVITELTTLNGVDFATETTLAALNTKVTAVDTDDVTISQPLPAGTNNIGDVDVATLPVAFNTGSASATTQRVVLASDSPSPVQPVNTGSFAQITNLVASAQTFTAPAGAIGFKIQAPSTNTENIAFSIGSVATITAGVLMEPGRSEDFDTGSNISVIATSAAAQTVTVIWKVRP